MPAAVTTRPAARRPGEKPAGAGTASRSAWTGATLVARHAGGTAATTVITRPAPNDAAAPVAGTSSPLIGRDTPNPDSSAARPRASPMPSSTPAAAAAAPSSTASPSTLRNTWPRWAPSVRSSASSRTRWPTMIEKVFQITNAPTNSDTPAKPTKK